MMLILPAIFAFAYWAFFAFVLGDWYWLQDASAWPGEWGIFWRSAHACMFTIGLIVAFIGGVMAHD